MDLVLLAVMLLFTLIVFGVDVSQKRHQFLNEQDS